MRLSVIVPTLGRPTLSRLLDSFELGPEDECLIVAHGTKVQERPGLRIFDYVGEQVRGGGPLRDFAIKQARGDYLVFNDDTDIFLPGALDAIRAAIGPEPEPLLFRVEIRGDSLFDGVAEGHVDGHQFVVPNIPAKLGTWGSHAHCDWHFIESTLAKWGGRFRAVDHTISRCA